MIKIVFSKKGIDELLNEVTSNETVSKITKKNTIAIDSAYKITVQVNHRSIRSHKVLNEGFHHHQSMASSQF